LGIGGRVVVRGTNARCSIRKNVECGDDDVCELNLFMLVDGYVIGVLVKDRRGF
jgi:ribosomal protein L27